MPSRGGLMTWMTASRKMIKVLRYSQGDQGLDHRGSVERVARDSAERIRVEARKI